MSQEDRQDQEDVDKAPVEENRQPPLPKSVNFLGEDVDSLMISLFDRKRSKYICQECKIICNLPMVGVFYVIILLFVLFKHPSLQFEAKIVLLTFLSY